MLKNTGKDCLIFIFAFLYVRKYFLCSRDSVQFHHRTKILRVIKGKGNYTFDFDEHQPNVCKYT